MPARTKWLLCLLAAASCAFGATVGFGIGASAQASVSPTAVLGPKSFAAHEVAASNYSGGHFLAADPNGGYWTTDWLGDVTAHRGAPQYGSPALSHLKLAQPIVGIAATPDGEGYWLVASDGGIFSYGDAAFYGSTGAIHLNAPIVGMATTPDGHGYWLVASDGGIFNYGDAIFMGSTGAIHLNSPIVGMATATDGLGYWLVASDGGIFTFGLASFYGSTGAIHLNAPIVGMARTPDGHGYWLVAKDGGIFTYGDAQFEGSLGIIGTVLGIVVNPTTGRYGLVMADGSAQVPSLTPPPAPPAPAPAPAPATPTAGTTGTTAAPRARSTTPTTTAPPRTTTTTTKPVASSNGAVPNAPAGVGAPTHLVLDDEFNTGALNESLWSPTWFGNGQVSNNTVMEESNVAVGPNGLALTLAGNSTGGIVSTNPDDGQPGHTGFQIAPTPGHPVYVEYKATLPTTGGQIANWPALWLTGQNWPMTGEIDVMEGFGNAEWHGITGSSPSNLTNPGGAGALAAPLAGPHTFGVLWSTTGVTFVYDGVIVGSANITLTGPMYLLMENSLGGPGALGVTMDVRYVRVWQ